jgi:anti-sigma regulatory factor (Ser/Thr protein kinase)
VSGDIAETRLDGTRADVGAGRRFVRQTLEAWDCESVVESAALVVSELITNVVLHARTAVEMRLHRRGDLVRIEVADHSPTLPRLRRFTGQAATGRGLQLVEAMGSAWGVDSKSGGKVVWVELAVEPSGRSRAAADADVDVDLAAFEALGGWDDEGGTPPQARTRAA